MNLLSIYKRIDEENIIVAPCDIPTIKGVAIQAGDQQGIFVNYDQVNNSDEEFEVLTHEYGHCTTGTFYNIDTPKITRRKCEYKADRKAVIDFLPIDKIKEAVRAGCQMPYEIAEYLDIPETFVVKACRHYKAMGLI